MPIPALPSPRLVEFAPGIGGVSAAADNSVYVVRDSLPLDHGTPQIFVLLNRRRSSSVAGGLDVFPDPDDIDARATFKLHRAHQAIDVLNVHVGISRVSRRMLNA
ncbi:MAG TPA: hypothetical protein VGQ35_13855 [Dongiaceae bacterium]|jgi:hypothetical protein|nr:hypothetical protein [Dongiaceae bacterium]